MHITLLLGVIAEVAEVLRAIVVHDVGSVLRGGRVAGFVVFERCAIEGLVTIALLIPSPGYVGVVRLDGCHVLLHIDQIESRVLVRRRDAVNLTPHERKRQRGERKRFLTGLWSADGGWPLATRFVRSKRRFNRRIVACAACKRRRVGLIRQRVLGVGHRAWGAIADAVAVVV